jgi:uridine kinase
LIGDKLVITDYHRAAARKIHDHIASTARTGRLSISVSGESGSGKSETAQCLAEALEADGLRCIVLAQDDYFKLPPRSNHERRLEDFSWIGPGEVRLDLLDEHVDLLRSGGGRVVKPLVYFEENRIGEETLDAGPYDAVIVEGTYTAMLGNLDVRAFIDRNYRQTKKARLRRGRDPDVQFLEKVLEKEHSIISLHRERADVVIDPPAEEVEIHSS